MHRLFSTLATLLFLLLLAEGCAFQSKRYALIEKSLAAGDAKRADTILQQAKEEYDSNSQVLYAMDRGITLQLAGDYPASNRFLEQAEQQIEDLYTRRIRTETKAFFTNDSKLPFEGEPFEQVWVNISKSLNYALLNEPDEAVVEARRIDHRLNVLANRVDEDEYHRDAYARYLSGIMYEAAGDLNNALVAYRKAYKSYKETRSWSNTGVPQLLKADLLRLTDALQLREEHQQYLTSFGAIAWDRWDRVKDLAHVIVVSYNGRTPKKEDYFLDVPISLDALQLVLLNKIGRGRRNTPSTRAFETVLYGLNGRVVRIALPTLVPQKTSIATSTITLKGSNHSFTSETQLVTDLTATSEKALDDRLASTTVKAVARAAAKFALAEGASYGARVAVGKDKKEAGQVVGLIVGILGKMFAVASEEADKRSWRTLPDEIHIARLWVPPGTYKMQVHPQAGGSAALGASSYSFSLRTGQTRFFLERVVR